MSKEIPEQNKVVQLMWHVTNKPRKPETPHERVQKVIRARTWETLTKKPTNFLKWKEENKLKKINEAESENESIYYNKFHSDITSAEWKEYFDLFLTRYFWNETDFYINDFDKTYSLVLEYFSDLIFNLSTDTEYWLILAEWISNLNAFERWKIKWDLWIYLLLVKRYPTKNLILQEIKECYLAWYNENKTENNIGLLLQKNIDNFIQLIYDLATDMPLCNYPNDEDEEFDD